MGWRVYLVLITVAILIVNFMTWLKAHDAKIAQNAVLLERAKVKEADDKIDEKRKVIRSNPVSRRELTKRLREHRWNRVG